ncbi:MAG: patatin-like phospholipase family protein [Acidimicrobiales bacterium]|nr:patatin-like phospholipase family protein [Acidimicrobiales bacterium]
MPTAFVLSGGGSLGAVQVGMLAALHEQRIRPDFLVGTSAGALNAAYVAAEGFTPSAIDRLGAIWRNLDRSSVFPLSPLRHALALAGRRASLCSAGPLRRLIDTQLRIRHLEDAALPIHVIATDVLSGEEVLLSTGDAVSAVLASAALPAVFPPVEREGRTLMDGGVADNTAVSQAVALGADRVVIVPAGFACALDHAPRSPLTAATHALTLMLEQRLIVEVAQLSDRVEMIVVPPLCPLTVSSTDFGHADELITRAQFVTRDWFESGNHHLPDPERFLSLHRHHAPKSDANA